jgi:hypothetical protein
VQVVGFVCWRELQRPRYGLPSRPPSSSGLTRGSKTKRTDIGPFEVILWGPYLDPRVILGLNPRTRMTAEREAQRCPKQAAWETRLPRTACAKLSTLSRDQFPQSRKPAAIDTLSCSVTVALASIIVSGDRAE